MKPIVKMIWMLIFLAACAPVVTTPPAALPVDSTPTQTATPAPSATWTLSVVETQMPTETRALSAVETSAVETSMVETPTITPLPTIPTFTPTFDARTFVTATPAPKAVCPQENPNISVEIFDSKKIYGAEEDDISKLVNKTLQLLNEGALKTSLVREYSGAQVYGKAEIIEKDITNDGVPEVIAQIIDGFVVYKCNQGKYENILEWWGDLIWYVEIISIKDMNADGIPEIVAAATDCSGTGCRIFKIFEWNGSTIENLVKIPVYDPSTKKTTIYDEIGIESPGGEKIADVNSDGMLELVVVGGKGLMGDSGYDVIRQKIDISSWDGNAFIPYSLGFSAPEYRFQAVQDADRETKNGNWSQAISLYQAAIFGKLGWWSAERLKAQDAKVDAFSAGVPTPDILVQEDTTEYPRLAAYAYYRMVILHTFLGQMDAVQVKYATLQEKFPAGSPGHPYVEMATAFWDAWQSTQKMYDGCAAAIGYAANHPEILVPLGSDYHGAQSHTYVPADVCPFR